MAWGKGAAAGLDDLCSRLRANDPTLQSLTILKHRKLDATEAQKLCASLAANTVLTELYASNHALPTAAAAEFARMLAANGTLTALCIGDSSFGDAGVAALSAGLCASASLKSLDLEHKSVTASGAAALAAVLAQSASLQQLSLARNPLTDDGAAALASQPPWRALSHLDASTCDLGPAGVSSLAALAIPPHAPNACLTSLNLSHNALGAEAGPALRQLLGSFRALRQLRLRGCQLADASIEGLAAGVAEHAALELLDLASNECGEAGGDALAAAVSSSPRLEHLDLGTNAGLPAAAVARLARAAHGEDSKLAMLDLTGVDLQGEPGASALSALSGCRRLRRLCLLGTRLGDAGAQELTLRLQDGGFEGLQELSVSACGMGLGGGLGALLQALRQPGNALALKVLECGANPASQHDGMAALVAELGEARPALQVYWGSAGGDEASQAGQGSGAA